MGREGIEVEIEPVTGEEREAARGQLCRSEWMSRWAMFCVRGPSSSTGRIFVQGIDGQPQPEHLCSAAQPGAQFVQLEVGDVEVAEAALMEDLSMLSCTSEPGGDGRLTIAEDPLGGGSVQPFGQRGEHHGDLMGRGFQTVQGGVAPGSESGAAGLTAKRLDALGMAMLAIADQRVDVSISDAEVRALRIGTGVARGVYAFGCSPPAFHLAPGTHRQQTLVLHLMREWRRDDRRGNRLGSGA